MRNFLLALAVVGLIGAMPCGAWAHDAYDDSQSHPLQLIAYLVHPVGYAAEWLVARPIHFLVSEPQLERIFGHRPHENPFGAYPVYDPEAED